MGQHDDKMLDGCGHDHVEGDVDCAGVATLLTEYVEDGLEKNDRAKIEEHLKYCPPCIEFMSQYQRASSACREVLLSKVPRDLESRLVDFLRMRCSKKS